MENKKLSFKKRKKLSEHEKNYLHQKLIVETPAILEIHKNNYLLMKFLSKWNEEKNENYLNELIEKLRVAKITKVFQDDFLTDDLLMQWDENLERLFNYIQDFIVPNNTKVDEPLLETKLQQPIKQKLKWKGTPGEFGAIMNELLENGYLPKIKDLKNTVRILNEVFEVKKETGEIADDNYLYKCFGEKKRGYLPGQLKISESDNLHKEK